MYAKINNFKMKILKIIQIKCIHGLSRMKIKWPGEKMNPQSMGSMLANAGKTRKTSRPETEFKELNPPKPGLNLAPA